MSKHVYSRLSADTRYTATEKGPGGMNRTTRSVLIRGGAGVALMGAGQIITPTGKRSEVSDEDAAFLERHEIFQLHKRNGFVHIEDSARDPENVAKDMSGEDPSKPKTPADVKKSAEEAAAKTGLSAEETLQVVVGKGKK